MMRLTRFELLLPLLLSSGSLLLAEPIINNVTNASGYADASVNLVLSDDPSSYSHLLGTGTASDGGYPNGSNVPRGGSVSGTQFYDPTLTTPGSPRIGFVTLSVLGTGGNNGGYASGTVSIPTTADYRQYGFPLGLVVSTCGAQNGQDPLCEGDQSYFFRNILGLIPVELGTPFTLSYSEYGQASSDEGGTAQGGGFNLDYSFRFLEADGVTPVAVQLVDTPEPSTIGLFSIACILLGCGSRPIWQRFRKLW